MSADTGWHTDISTVGNDQSNAHIFEPDIGSFPNLSVPSVDNLAWETLLQPDYWQAYDYLWQQPTAVEISDDPAPTQSTEKRKFEQTLRTGWVSRPSLPAVSRPASPNTNIDCVVDEQERLLGLTEGDTQELQRFMQANVQVIQISSNCCSIIDWVSIGFFYRSPSRSNTHPDRSRPFRREKQSCVAIFTYTFVDTPCGRRLGTGSMHGSWIVWNGPTITRSACHRNLLCCLTDFDISSVSSSMQSVQKCARLRHLSFRTDASSRQLSTAVTAANMPSWAAVLPPLSLRVRSNSYGFLPAFPRQLMAHRSQSQG